MKFIGHRGACALEPENTLRSIKRAIELGCDMVEIDLHRVGDQLIVIHDDTLERTTNGEGSIHDHHFETLRKFDAGMGERIPTLEEVLAITSGKVPVNIEIKGKNVVPLLRTMLKIDGSMLISSFDWDQLIELRARNALIDIGVLGKEPFPLAQKLNAHSVHPHVSELDSLYSLRAHRDKFHVYLYTVRDKHDWGLAMKHRVDGIFIDDPIKFPNKKWKKLS